MDPADVALPIQAEVGVGRQQAFARQSLDRWRHAPQEAGEHRIMVPVKFGRLRPEQGALLLDARQADALPREVDLKPRQDGRAHLLGQETLQMRIAVIAIIWFSHSRDSRTARPEATAGWPGCVSPRLHYIRPP